MPAEPLLDLNELDLSRTIVAREEIYEALKQRGRFALLDGVVHHDLERGIVVGYLDAREDDWWAEDHIPGRPIFPGTLMIEAAAQLGSYDFYCRLPDARKLFCGFTAVLNTRFRDLVLPGSRFVLVAKLERVRATLFHYKMQGFVDGKIVFETEIRGMSF